MRLGSSGLGDLGVLGASKPQDPPKPQKKPEAAEGSGRVGGPLAAPMPKMPPAGAAAVPASPQG